MRWLGRKQDESLDEWTGEPNTITGVPSCTPLPFDGIVLFYLKCPRHALYCPRPAFRARARPFSPALTSTRLMAIGGPVNWALSGEWDRVARHAIGTILAGFSAIGSAPEAATITEDGASGGGQAAKLIILHNPSDPFLDPDDVQLTKRLAVKLGIPVVESHARCDHVQSLFSSPRTVFDLIGAQKKRREAEPMGQSTSSEVPAADELEDSLGQVDREGLQRLVTLGVDSP
eukprot:scaffold25989_cov32-Tisochrysis_lutea.AAC.2